VASTVEQYLSKRAQAVRGSAGRQLSTPGEAQVINLGSGTPDFRPPEFVLEAATRSLTEGKIHYTPWLGLSELREAIAGKLERDNGLSVDPETEILVTTGAQEALMTTLLTLLNPGDEVLIPSPHYTVYSRVASIAGATVVPVVTTLQDNFALTPEALKASLSPNSKVLILVSPNNPTGTVLAEATLRQIAEIVQERDLIVISDEIYEHYLFDDARHTSFAALPEMKARTVTINSLSKGFALTGLRVGYLSAPAALIEAMLPFHHAMTICAPVTAQYAAIAALSASRDWFAPILAEYARRRQLWMAALEQARLPYAKPQGAYYVFFDCRPTGLDSATFVERLRAEAQVALGTGGSGAGEGFIRGSLMQRSPALEQGLERLAAFVARCGA
jgi:aspartate/methionine/tyrosine aminotransferase